MSHPTTNGRAGRIEPLLIREARLRRDVSYLGTLFGILALGCELALEAEDEPIDGKEG